MAARPGLANLILTWRRMVDDAESAVWDDDAAQEILDRRRADIWKEALTPQPSLEDGETVYKVFLSNRENFEEVASGTTIWRVYDANGTTRGTADYTADYIRGIVTFTADQEGSTRYLDGRSYDLDGAAADAWRERAAKVSSFYSFKAGENAMSRSDWFKHCETMAKFYAARSRPSVVEMVRGDLV